MMVVYYVLLFFNSLPLTETRLAYETPNNTCFTECVTGIIKKYFLKCSALSVVDMETENEEIFKIANEVSVSSIILRKSDTRLTSLNGGYFIAAEKCTDFINNFPDLAKEKYWEPSARFLIMIHDLTNILCLGNVFDLLLTYNVINVLLMDESTDPNLYTYNPFENYGCGQRYDKIIEYGKCSMVQNDLYPYKLVTGLRNCTFKVAIPHWPPYSINPAKSDGLLGVEQMVLKEIARMERFQINYIYSDTGEEFSTIENDVVAVGPLDALQKREVQMMAGGLILTYPRAKAFSYIWGHLAYAEEISYQVQRATGVADWKYTYLEFDALVWTIFVIAFLVFLVLFVVLVRPKDKGQIVLKMIGFLFLAGYKIRGSFFARYLFLHWILFAYIVNVYYVSNLVSFTTDPLTNYQVSDEKDLVKYNMQPCVSTTIKKYLASVEVNESLWKSQREGCEHLLESIRTVSKSNKLYTVVIRSLYAYNKHNYVDKWGKTTMYTFKEPLTKVVYAIYLYKGFPVLENLHIRTLRLRENGLVEGYLRLLYASRRVKHHNGVMEQRYHVVVPWYILIFGYLLSLVVFLMEIIAKRYFS